METADRAPRLRDTLPDAECDGLLVTNVTNIRYLTGFTGSAAMLLVAPDELLFVTDGRYRDQAADELASAGVDARIEIGRSSDEQRELLSTPAKAVGRLGLEAEHVSWAQKRRFRTDWFAGTKLVATEGLVERLRQVKDEGEVARIEAASAMADAALAAVRHEGPSFETIVASGPNAAKPHHRAGPRRITEGDLVVIDFGALVEGYHSDMTRTIMVGEPSETQARMYEVVAESQATGVAAVRAGAEAQAVDEACRAVIREAGWEDAFLHGTGHGLGLDIHEPPRVSMTADATLVDRHVVTVEPGVYLAEHGGVRIEDTVVVTPDGCRPLTRAPKGPHV
jgi:Xaa-Pro aminopeptidase